MARTDATSAPAEADALASVGPGVLVLGMHRSGTSATARVLNLLGLSICHDDDRWGEFEYNRRGVWESRSLGRFCERLFIHLGGHWWAPPAPLAPGWELAPRLAERRARGRELFVAAHPSSPWVWKDPACLLVPFWDAVLGFRPPRIVSVRRPDEVATSLYLRSGTIRPVALALWERYVRDTFLACDGVPTLVGLYDDLMRDPGGWCGSAIEFLAGSGIQLADPIPDTVRDFVGAELRHHESTTDLGDDPDLTAEQLALWEWARQHCGSSAGLAIDDLPPPSPSTEDWLEGSRFASRFWRPPRPATPATRRRRAARARRSPSVRVLVTGAGTPSALTLERLDGDLPRGGEIIVDPDGRLGRDVVLADVVVFCDVESVPEPGWLDPLLATLDDPIVGLAGSTLRSLDDDPDGGAPVVAGFIWRGPMLTPRWLKVRREGIDSVAFASTRLAAMRRDVLVMISPDPQLRTAPAIDAELSLSLWRMGYQCRVATASSARHVRMRPGTLAVERSDILRDALRIGLVHFGPERAARQLSALGPTPGFGESLVDVLQSDVDRRRVIVEAKATYDDDWFFRHFPFDPFPVPGHAPPRPDKPTQLPEVTSR